MGNDPRSTRAWRRLRDQVIAEEPTCRLRFPDICTVVSTTADHIKLVHTHPELALARLNCRGACKECNAARGRMPDQLLPTEQPSSSLSIFDLRT